MVSINSIDFSPAQLYDDERWEGLHQGPLARIRGPTWDANKVACHDRHHQENKLCLF